jgi:hypothetical protein
MKKRKVNRGLPASDGVLICKATERAGKVTVSASANRRLRATAATREEAETLLLEKIWDEFDLDEPVAFRYESGDQSKNVAQASLVRIAPNETEDASNPALYFTEGFCPICRSGKGLRNSEVLKLDHLSGGASGAIVRLQPYFRCGLRVHLHLFHKAICDVLSRECKGAFEFREVLVRGKVAGKVREAIPTEVIPCVVPIARSARAGGICGSCGASFIYHEPRKVFVSEDGARRIRQRGACGIDSPSSPVFCMLDKVWRKIEKLQASKGLVAYPVEVLGKQDICSQPFFGKIVPLKL